VTDSAEASDARLIDLHSHTNASDGTFSPAELVLSAKRRGLSALAITDHDTFAGYEEALPVARAEEFELIRGIELNSRLRMGNKREQYVHLLAYWPGEEPTNEFNAWLEEEREDRRNRNQRLAEALGARGVEITLEEVEARGRSLAGRPHFARILVEKGYAEDNEDAFQKYLGESAPSYVERQSAPAEKVIQKVRKGGGFPVVAHPVRLAMDRDQEREVLMRLRAAGLLGLEIYHSEHSPALQAHYRQLAEEIGLLPTGGSDFHGAVKPDVELGAGRNGNVRVPFEFLERMRETRTI